MTYSVNFANYTIGEDAYQNVREVCRHYGKKALLISGEMALKAGKEKIVQALSDLSGTDSDSQAASTSAVTRGKKYAEDSEIEIVDTVLFGTDCMYARMEELAEHAKKCGADMIFGMGGGKALDTAKGTAEKAGLPVFTFPTIAATCAATTALSVVYKEDGNFDSFYFYDKLVPHSVF
ncbi:iron-containing alcohol dehydrogenase [Blautia sp. MSJ-36]|uniref:iron-containing alcohol dehydrogenase n=1 Tax=Blautia sp. MSJ-36 TaxID=2841530 RepID=UPI001C117A0F|nr:iron-containing alcohol dehydrogenase [Blautia sp. MSJ-36]MBU5447520.1 iron-containing alcohol dehydrogenase [Blautia sp. MSJ-36]